MTQIQLVSTSNVTLVKSNCTDLDVAMAAWVSNYGSSMPDLPMNPDEYKLGLGSAAERELMNKRIQGLINFLYRERHLSPFEHGSFTFLVDTPIFVAREFMRHRTFSYNETSGRYKELEPRFYIPNGYRPLVQTGKVGEYRFTPGTPEQWRDTLDALTHSYEYSWEAYQRILGMGVAREVARDCLPVGIMTQFYATCNPRNLMQFLTLRNDDNALNEIRFVGARMEESLAATMPMVYSAYKKFDYRSERSELENLRKKVAQLEAYETYSDNLGWSERSW